MRRIFVARRHQFDDRQHIPQLMSNHNPIGLEHIAIFLGDHYHAGCWFELRLRQCDTIPAKTKFFGPLLIGRFYRIVIELESNVIVLRPADDLLCHGKTTPGQHPRIELVGNCRCPKLVEIMVRSGFHLGPIVYRHLQFISDDQMSSVALLSYPTHCTANKTHSIRRDQEAVDTLDPAGKTRHWPRRQQRRVGLGFAAPQTTH